MQSASNFVSEGSRTWQVWVACVADKVREEIEDDSSVGEHSVDGGRARGQELSPGVQEVPVLSRVQEFRKAKSSRVQEFMKEPY